MMMILLLLLIIIIMMIRILKVKKYKKTSRATSALDTGQRCVGMCVDLKLSSVPYNVWFSLYIQTRACEKGTHAKCFYLV